MEQQEFFYTAAALVKVLIYLVLMWYAFKSKELGVGILAFMAISINYFLISGNTVLYVIISSMTAPLLSWLLIRKMNRKD